MLITKAHISNKNFPEAERWLQFAENYISQSSNIDQLELDSVKFLFNLKKSENKEEFIQNLEINLITEIEKEGVLDGYSETLKTIFSTILSEVVIPT